MTPAMSQYRDGPPVPYGPDSDKRAYAAWAEQHGADLVYHCEDDYILNVYAHEEDGLIWLIQSGDEIAIPVQDFGQFIYALERVNAGVEADS